MTFLSRLLRRWSEAMFPQPQHVPKLRSGETTDPGQGPVQEVVPSPMPDREAPSPAPDETGPAVPKRFARDDRTLAEILGGIPMGLRTRDLYARPDLVFDSPRRRVRYATRLAEASHAVDATNDDVVAGGQRDRREVEDQELVVSMRRARSRAEGGSLPSSGGPGINPATALPMIDGAMVDVAGNPYGMDLHGRDCTLHSNGGYDAFGHFQPCAFGLGDFSRDW
jgi:hypothetical protein